MRIMALLILLIGFRISDSAAVLEYGGEFSRIKKSGNRVLTQGNPISILWDAQSRTPLLRDAGLADLAGDVLLAYSRPFVKVYDARTLALKASFKVSDFNGIGLGRGGTYIWIMYDQEFQLHDLEGKLLCEKSGSFGPFSTRSFMDSSEALVYAGKGDSILVLSAKDGSIKTYPFLGDFSTWFLDGSHFVTTLGGFVRIYDRNGIQENFFSMERMGEMGGCRGYFWVKDYIGLAMYSITNTASPVKSFPGQIPLPSPSTSTRRI